MNKRVLIISLSGILIWGCTERIDVQLDSTYSRLVVDGAISTDAGPHRIALTSTASYFYNEPALRVVNATLSLTDGTSIFPMHETVPGQSGMYETDSGFSGAVGKNYVLNIGLSEAIGGASEYSASCSLKDVTRIDSIRAVFHPEWGKEGVWSVKLWAQEPANETNYYMFNLYRNGILLTDTLNKKVVSDDALINGSYITGIDVVYLNNAHKWETIYPGDTITLQMSGITKEYYNFIDQVKQAGFNIPFFSGPPANVEGNIDNGGVGFFAAYSNDYAKAVVK